MIADRIEIENNEIIFRLDMETAGANAAEIAVRARDEAIEAASQAIGAKDEVETIGNQVSEDRIAVSSDREAAETARNVAEEKAGEAVQAAIDAQEAANSITPEIFATKSLFQAEKDSDFTNSFKLDSYGTEGEPIFESTPTWQNTTSTFSGWGTPIGRPQNFNGVTIRIRARSIPISQVRIRIHNFDSFGDILVDQTVEINIPSGQDSFVTISFPEIVNNENEPLFLIYQCDQLSDRYGISNSSLFSESDGYGRARWFANGAMGGNGISSTSNVERIWASIIQAKNLIGFTDDLISLIKSKIVELNSKAIILIPSVIYSTQGVECNVFWDNVIFSDYPLSDLHIDVTCSLGAQYERGWRYTPSGSVANSSLKVDVSFGGEIIATKTVTVITNSAIEGAATKKVLCIGDSTTAGGQYVSIINQDYNVNPSITFLGTQGSGANKHEGHSGKTFGWFLGSESPFWNGSEISFAGYLSTNGWTMNASDLVSIHLGINDIFNDGSEAKRNQIKVQCDTLIANIRSAVPGINIAICVTIPPSISQDAFGTSYQNGRSLHQYLRHYTDYVFFMLTNYDTAEMRSNKIFMPQFNCNLDRTYNFPQSTVPANSRTSKTVTRWTNGVHPAAEGYYQMGDVLWAFIKGL